MSRDGPREQFLVHWCRPEGSSFRDIRGDELAERRSRVWDGYPFWVSNAEMLGTHLTRRF
jgi:hypothetical protein